MPLHIEQGLSNIDISYITFIGKFVAIYGLREFKINIKDYLIKSVKYYKSNSDR